MSLLISIMGSSEMEGGFYGRACARLLKENKELKRKLDVYEVGMPDREYLLAIAKWGQHHIDSNAMSLRDYDEQKKYYDWLKLIAAQKTEGVQ